MGTMCRGEQIDQRSEMEDKKAFPLQARGGVRRTGEGREDGCICGNRV